MSRTFLTQSIRSVFAEARGLCLIDPATLDAALGTSCEGLDLLTRFTTTEDGEGVAAVGAVIPILGLESDFYQVMLAPASPRPVLDDVVLARSEGWVLEVRSPEVLLCGLGYLIDFRRDHPAHARLQLPLGWYRITIELRVSDADELRIVLLADPSETVPRFLGDVTRTLTRELDPDA